MLNTSSHPAHDNYTPQLAGLGHRVVGTRGESIAPETLDRLEQLDDTVFAVLGGDPLALDQLATRWREAVQTVDASLVDESRREYVRHARSLWKRSKRQPSARLPEGFAALELLEVLSEEEAA